MRHLLPPVLASFVAFMSLLVAAPARADEAEAVGVEAAPAPEAAPGPQPTFAPPRVIVIEAPKVDVAEAREERSSWYGYQTMAVDGAAVALMAMGVKTELPQLMAASFATYALGAPIVHLAHGSPGRFAADIGMRLGGPTLGAFTGAGLVCLADGSCSAFDAAIGGALGMALGGAAALAVDYAVLSREARQEKWDGKPRVAPTLTAAPSGGAVGLGGAF